MLFKFTVTESGTGSLNVVSSSFELKVQKYLSVCKQLFTTGSCVVSG